MTMFADVLATLEQAENQLEDIPEAKTNTEALVRIEFANSLAAAIRFVRVLAIARRVAQGTGNAIASSRGPTARPIALAIRKFLDSGFAMDQIVDRNATTAVRLFTAQAGLADPPPGPANNSPALKMVLSENATYHSLAVWDRQSTSSAFSST